MGTRDPRVDAYIEKSPEFAVPILTYLREIVHSACPDVQETMKWSAPFFDYQGVMCNMAAFKAHCAFGFWKGALIDGLPQNSNNGGESAGNLGRITECGDIPTKKQMTAWIRQAMKLNESGVIVTRAKAAPAGEQAVHPLLASALRKSKSATAAFKAFAPGHRREYIEWIADAKREETQVKRVAQAIEMLEHGKTRHWKYQTKK